MSAKFESRDIVLPGDLLYEGRARAGDNTYRREGKIYATRIGLVDYTGGRVSVIALRSSYTPIVGDVVIGTVVDVELGQWKVDIGAEKEAILTVNEAIDRPFGTNMNLVRILDVGDTIAAKIVDLDKRRTPILSIRGRDLGKLENGFIVTMTPSKIPRLIGKKGSMINMILKETGCHIIIGQNGRILVNGPNREMEDLVTTIIEKIEAEAHIPGLTNRIQAFLKSYKEKKE